MKAWLSELWRFRHLAWSIWRLGPNPNAPRLQAIVDHWRWWRRKRAWS